LVASSEAGSLLGQSKKNNPQNEPCLASSFSVKSPHRKKIRSQSCDQKTIQIILKSSCHGIAYKQRLTKLLSRLIW